MQTIKVSKKVDVVVHLDLVQNGEGGVSLIATDNNGIRLSQIYLIDFHEDGTISLCENVSEDLPFPLDKKGCLIIK